MTFLEGTIDLSEEIPKEAWEPILGGKLHEFWDKVIPDEGDEIVVKGSSVSKVIFGFYSYDAETCMVPSNVRADVDVVVKSTAQLDRIKEFARSKIVQNAVSATVNVGDLEVNYTKQETVRDIELAALEQLNTWAQTLDPERCNYYSQKINTQIQNLTSANTEELLGLNHLFQHETLALKLTRTMGGEIHVTAVDPVGYLSANETQQVIKEIPTSPPTTQINANASELIFLEAFCEMKNFEFDSLAPVWALETIPRRIVMESELDTMAHFWDEKSEDPDAILPFERYMIEISKRMMQNDPPFQITGKTKQFLKEKGYSTVRELFIAGTQKAFVRGCAASLHSTISSIIEDFGLVGIIHDDLQSLVQTFNEKMHAYYEAHGIPNNEDELKTYLQERAKIPEHLFFDNYDKLISMNYSAERQPNNMSEIIGLLLTSADWSKDTHAKQIHEIINHWKPSGTLQGVWRNTNVDFDQGLDFSTIVDNIEKFKKQ